MAITYKVWTSCNTIVPTTLFCLISEGLHLELHIAIKIYGEYHSLPK